MSQAGSVETSGSGPIPPEVATEYIADVGSAVPVANQLEILGDYALAGLTPISTTGSGNTITTVVQLAQSNAFSSATTAGLASFDVSSFNVDANGFVTFSGTMNGIDSINVDASSVPGTDPVVPDGTGLVTMTGRQVPSLVVGANVLRSNSIAANSLTYEIQQAGSNATESTNYNGVAHFNSSQFTVSNGFVSLIGGSLAIDSVGVQTGTSPVVPTGAGLITINGAVVAAGTNPVRTDGTGANTLAVEVQISQALAATDATKIGLCNFSSAQFSVDANGFVTLLGGGEAIDSIGVDATSGAGTNPVLPTGAGLITVNGAVVAAGTNPVRTVSTAANVYQIQNQISQAIAATDATKIGLCNFKSSDFSVDANGFVSASTTGIGKTITGDSGGALSPTANNWNIVGLSGSKTSGSGSTLTIKSPPYADQGGSVSVTLNSGSFSTATITLTTPVTAGLADGDLLEFVATTANVLTIQFAATQVGHIGSVASSVAGTFVSTAIGDAIVLRYQASTNDWWATSVIGNWTIT